MCVYRKDLEIQYSRRMNGRREIWKLLAGPCQLEWEHMTTINDNMSKLRLNPSMIGKNTGEAKKHAQLSANSKRGEDSANMFGPWRQTGLQLHSVEHGTLSFEYSAMKKKKKHNEFLFVTHPAQFT